MPHFCAGSSETFRCADRAIHTYCDCSLIFNPQPSKPTTFFGLSVNRRIVLSPRSTRICAPMPFCTDSFHSRAFDRPPLGAATLVRRFFRHVLSSEKRQSDLNRKSLIQGRVLIWVSVDDFDHARHLAFILNSNGNLEARP